MERALRVASLAHREQTRKGSATPYITHPAAVAFILQEAGFSDPEWLAAALLHDVPEDTAWSLERLRGEFPPAVVAAVEALTETKCDDNGAPRPWRIRKEEHLAHIAAAPLSARAIALADKLHNLATIVYDLRAGEDVWPCFNAGRAELRWYYESMVAAAAQNNPELQGLARQCRILLSELFPSGAAS